MNPDSPTRLRLLLLSPRQRLVSALALLSLLQAPLVAGCEDSRAKQASAEAPIVHEITDATTGLTSTADGFTFESPIALLDASREYSFRIAGPNAESQTNFQIEQTKLLHLYAIRDDLTDFVHLHPSLSPDGTWSVRLDLTRPGPHHVYVSFLLRDAGGKLHHLVLSRPLTVSGHYELEPLPPPSSSAEVDGYLITFSQPRPKGWTVMSIPARITRAGQPVTGLESYLDAYAHMSAVRAANHALGHAHPLEPVVRGRTAGPQLTFHTEFPGSGDYRVFVEFQVDGQLHAAALTVRVE